MTATAKSKADFESWFKSLLASQESPQLREILSMTKEILFQNWRASAPAGSLQEPSMIKLMETLALNFAENEFECGYKPSGREITAFKRGMIAISEAAHLSSNDSAGKIGNYTE